MLLILFQCNKSRIAASLAFGRKESSSASPKGSRAQSHKVVAGHQSMIITLSMRVPQGLDAQTRALLAKEWEQVFLLFVVGDFPKECFVT